MLKTGFMKRVVSGMGAYTYAQMVTIGTQILGVPIFLSLWNMDTYGNWLMLSAVPVYFAMSDLGVVAVAGNKMTMAMANQDISAANEIFQSALLMVVAMIIVVLLTSFSILYLVDIEFLQTPGYKLAMCLLIVASLISVFGSLLVALFTANGKFSTGTYLVTTTRLVEWIFSIVAVIFYKEIIFAAAGYLIGRILMTIFHFMYTLHAFNHVKWSLRGADWVMIKLMLKPSFAFMALPVGSAINIQGMTLIVGSILGSSTVVVFNIYRTLSRTLVQLALILSKPLWPEFSRLYGLGQNKKIIKIYVVGSIASVVVMGCGFVFLHYSASYILEYWTSGKVGVDGMVLLVIILSSCISGVAQIATTVLAATNHHVEYFVFFLILSIFSVGVAYNLPEDVGLIGIGCVLVAYEAILLVACTLIVKYKIINKNQKNMEYGV